MLRLIVIALAVVFIGGCWNSEIGDAEKAVKATLKDPESAIFKGLKSSPSGSVCGTVNAKNSYGGYTGPEYFAYENGSLYWAIDREAPSEVADKVAFYDKQIEEIEKVKAICKAADGK